MRVTPSGPGDLACAVCGATAWRKIFQKRGVDFVRCASCGLERIDPVPTREQLDEHYRQSYADGGYASFTSATEVRRAIAKARYDQVVQQPAGHRWLDVGCSGGEFMEQVIASGHEAEGIDLCAQPVEELRKKGLTAFASRFEDFEPREPYDVVTGFDVLEHSEDPRGFLQAAFRWLKPGGRIVLTFPNAQSFHARLLMRRFWFFYIPDEHLYYFDPTTIQRILESEGFEAVRSSRAIKWLSFSYSLKSLSFHGPGLARVLGPLIQRMPAFLAEALFPIYLGELWTEATRGGSAPPTGARPDAP